MSATYNMWPASRVKWVLRRFDHSAIYLLIAGTYTPFLTRINGGLVSPALLGGDLDPRGVGHLAEACLPRAVRSSLDPALSRIGLERRDVLRRSVRGPARLHHVVACSRWPSLFGRRDLPRMGASAISRTPSGMRSC